MRTITAVVAAVLIVVAACAPGAAITATDSVTVAPSGIAASAPGTATATASPSRAVAPTSPTSSGAATSTGTFIVRSPVMADGGTLPIRFTCDGAAVTPPLAWGGAPAGTVGYAVTMHTVPGPGETHWYWVLYDIAPTVDHLDEAATSPATVGTNSVNGKNGYAPPCSRGPGPKVYTFTVYALSGTPDLPDPMLVSRQALLEAIDGMVVGRATISVTYSRAGTSDAGSPPLPPAGHGWPQP